MSTRDDSRRSLVDAETQRLPRLAAPRRSIASGTPAEPLERIAMLERENAELRAELAVWSKTPRADGETRSHLAARVIG